ncbi:Neur_chan_LBD domain-containing protein [Gammaproteobacteria bacterium]
MMRRILVSVILLLVPYTVSADEISNSASQVTKTVTISAPRTTETNNLDKLPENAPRPIRIGVAVSVNEISKISDQSGTFDGSLDLQLRWNDPTVAFDAKKTGVNRLVFPQEAAAKKLATIWNPAITLTNAKVQVLEQGIFIYADGTVVHIQRLKGTFDANYRLAAFPFDTQALPIRLVSRKYNMNQVVLIQEQIDINKSGLRQGINLVTWKPKRIEFATSRTRGWNGEYFSEMEARILVARLPQASLFAIFIPFLLILLIPTVMTLYAKADTAPRLTAWSASILSLIALNFSFSTRYAALESDSFVMQLVTIGFGYQMGMTLLTVTLLSPPITDRISNKLIVPEVLGYLRWTIPPTLIGIILTKAMLTALS